MNAIKFLLLLFSLVSTAVAAAPAGRSLSPGHEVTLNAAAHDGDSIFVNPLSSLELIASTPEAKSGDWNGIKQYMKQALGGLDALTGFAVFGIPVEELLFAVSFGMYWAGAYEHINWKR